MSCKPPRLGTKILGLFLPEHDKPYLLGDYEELYIGYRQEKGALLAFIWYWRLILLTVPSFIKQALYWRIVMLKNYLRTAYRNLIKHPSYSFINIAGLAIGLACCFLIALYIFDEMSYDRFHKKANQIYRIGINANLNGKEFIVPFSSPPVADALFTEFPEVKKATRLYRELEEPYIAIKYEEKNFNETRFFYADANFFEVFTIPFLKGNSDTALSQPNSIVMTQSASKRYFGNEDPLGKTIKVNDVDFLITGVAQDLPHNSHFHFDFLASFITLDFSKNQGWLNNALYTYILLQDNFPPDRLEGKFADLVRKYAGPQFQALMGQAFHEFLASGNRYGLFMQPLTDIHLHSNMGFELEANSDIKYIYIFSATALIILLLACINFMNLATARSAGRAREVGVRKVLGSKRPQLIRQFLTESVLVCFIAAFFAAFLVRMILPAFNKFLGRPLGLGYFDQWYILPALALAVAVLGILAGTYPAFVLSAFYPANVLKGSSTSNKGGRSPLLRNGLVIFQFTISIILLISTMVVRNQLDYVQNKKLGFNKEQVLIIHGADGLSKHMEAFKQELLQNPSIVRSAASNTLLGTKFDMPVIIPEGAPKEEYYSVSGLRVDADFAETMQMEMVEGRFFAKDNSSDLQAVVLNETAITALGLKNPIGKRVFIATGIKQLMPIIGVIQDFHFESLHTSIKPMAMFFQPEMANFLSVRIQTNNLEKTLGFVEEKWKSFAPDRPFTSSFLDRDFDRLYRAERQVGQIFFIFSLLAVFIACLGLFGLTAFTASQRTKEIGIRKVHGASVSSIILMLSKDFTKWVLLANIIAWPVAYFAMAKWLQNFAYRTHLEWSVFVLSGLIALIIAVLTVSYQSIKAARANPIDSLRYE